EEHPLTAVTEVRLPNARDDAFRIIASSEITRVKKSLLPDNRLVIDLFNAEIDLPKSEYDLPDNGYIARVRTGQNQVTPEMVSRIVFDLSASVNYSVGLSTDRKEVTVRFERNQISDVAFSSDGAADYITVRGDTRPVTSVFTLTNPDRLVIDVPLGVINEQERAENGVFATTIRTAQFESSTARIVVDVKRTPAFEVSYEGTVTKIKITEPTYRNIAFDPEKKALVLPKIGGQVLVLQQITETDRYDENKYIFNLNADYSGLLGYGDYRIGDDWINSINIQTKGGKTELTVNQNRILSYDISEDANNIYIKPISPKEKYDFVVIIDPGHGGAHTGTRGNGLEEEALNLAISQKLVAMLEADGRVKVYETRTSDAHLNTDLSTDLLMRSAIANTTGDVFISIHHNSFSATSNGTETYYDKGNNTQVGGASRQMADIIQKNLLEELGFTDREVQTNDYSVLRHTKIPAVLAEIGFVSNPEEAAKLATDEYQTKAAKAIFEAIMELFEIYQPKR
ncbi:MAG: N-acetylmuramoyl-L-alanine amidase, partial [Clostridiales bacterium]|nr:N-acetylmuramoyl-L-alanine amidase [Clostridiales bacterium]